MAGRVAVLGTPGGYAAAHTAFQQSWRALAAVTVLAAIAAIGMTPRRTAAPAPASTGTGALAPLGDAARSWVGLWHDKRPA